MTPKSNAILLADIGGTNARFAWQSEVGGPIETVRSYPCAEFASLQMAIEAYLLELGRGHPDQAAIGIANPVSGDRVSMTNHHWSFSIEQMRQALGLQRLVVMNDFTALALALPDLADDEKRLICGGAPVPGAALALIGPGTGLGVSGLIPAGTGKDFRYQVLDSEGGHGSLCASTPREWAVLQHLQTRFGHASAERAVSGQGLVWVYEALSSLDGAPTPAQPNAGPLTAAQISAAALAHSDSRAGEALELFFAFLGAMAGNLALTLGARGGLYLGGGILPRLADRLACSAFQSRFVGKGRFSDYLQAIPVYLIQTQESPALRGVARSL
ncbi:glucokinase [Paucibacter sp. B2R-40]|uniref:glucokinase n=1 Tax=Paucibacter sp. B2R-40 TaxID=2893554 RepID=UPI0021E45466|nr:glucokinase [Paucibacter sp. B2R-40]MCV2356013.1 glucokinase [Paucibacter sp. B2R-40]